jgi:hypothetical protein
MGRKDESGSIDATVEKDDHWFRFKRYLPEAIATEGGSWVGSYYLTTLFEKLTDSKKFIGVASGTGDWMGGTLGQTIVTLAKHKNKYVEKGKINLKKARQLIARKVISDLPPSILLSSLQGIIAQYLVRKNYPESVATGISTAITGLMYHSVSYYLDDKIRHDKDYAFYLKVGNWLRSWTSQKFNGYNDNNHDNL